MTIIRFFLSKFLLLLNFIFQAKAPVLTDTQKKQIERNLAGVTLYQFEGCPFCIKARRAFRRMGVELPIKDAMNDAQAKDDLVKLGGEYQVPCLRIKNSEGPDTWMYESDVIIDWVKNKIAI